MVFVYASAVNGGLVLFLQGNFELSEERKIFFGQLREKALMVNNH